MTEQDDEKKVFTLPIERQGRVKKMREQSGNLRAATRLIPRNFLVSFVSEYDCFLGALLKVLYAKKPELLNDSSKQITYSDLLAFESLEDAKNQVLEKEIESIIRKSHAEHFSILENKFDIKLRKGLDIWPDFIEITERRNLFVHSNGVVSSQYLKVCAQHGYSIDGIAVGDKLSVDSEYLKRAYKVIYEISAKLAHVLWRKLFPNEREDADTSLNDVCFSLIVGGKNILAADILEFALTMPKHHSDTVRRIMAINLAQAYKRSDNNNKCTEVLRRFDWSATGYEFKLAVAVLPEDFDRSAQLLKTVVNAGDLSEKEIVEWPLFLEFRETEQFLKAFKELFDKDYAEQEELIKEEFANHMESIFGEEDKKQNANNIDEARQSVEATAEEIEKELEGAST